MAFLEKSIIMYRTWESKVPSAVKNRKADYLIGRLQGEFAARKVRFYA
jgi:hypothetical protein